MIFGFEVLYCIAYYLVFGKMIIIEVIYFIEHFNVWDTSLNLISYFTL